MHVSMDANGGELLPQSTEPDKDQCSKPEQGMFCFKAGDRRVSCLQAVQIVSHNC